MKRYRYPGVRPFETNDSDLFYGRDRDSDDLLGLIRQEKLVVLFGKSGYGKSSLINAAVIPELEKNAHTKAFTIRFGTHANDEPLSGLLLNYVQGDKRAVINPEMDFLDDLCPEKTLWYYAQKYHREGSRWVFFFDQFEEYFQQAIHLRRKFEEELSELLYTNIPQQVLDRSHDLAEDKMDLLLQPLDVRVIFSIRGDRLSELDSMKGRLPAILQNRFELKALSREQARDAIKKPALLDDADFTSSPYEYADEALESILGKLSGPKGGIEAFQLQILCDYIDNQVVSGLIPDRNNDGRADVDVEDLPDFEVVYGRYYERRIEVLPEALRKAARHIIEDELIYEDEQTGEARRISLDHGVLLRRAAGYGATSSLLLELENSFLLRRETNLLSGYSYEISHDTLLVPIMKARRERIHAEKEMAAEEQRMQVEAKEAEAKEQRKVRERALAAEREAKQEAARRRQATVFAVIAGLLLVISIVMSVLARKEQQKADLQKQKAVHAREIADQQRTIAEEERKHAMQAQERAQTARAIAEEALGRAHKAETEKVLIEVEYILQRAKQLKSRYPAIYHKMNREAKDILAKYPDNDELRKKMDSISG